jgi:hypothetical protein
MTNTKIQNCRNSAKIQYNIVERETDHTPNTQIYDRSHSKVSSHVLKCLSLRYVTSQECER